MLQRYRGYLLFGIVLLAVAGVLVLETRRPRSEGLILNAATDLPSPAPTVTPRPLRVYVNGAVQRPDVYLLPPDSIVKDALLAAGGAAPDADLDRINLAQPLGDGQQIYVPRWGATDPPLPPAAERMGGSLRVNINTADTTLLESLPGIGPSLAERIVAYRQANGPFTTVEDIVQVPGIGPATLDKIRELITTN